MAESVLADPTRQVTGLEPTRPQSYSFSAGQVRQIAVPNPERMLLVVQPRENVRLRLSLSDQIEAGPIAPVDAPSLPLLVHGASFPSLVQNAWHCAADDACTVLVWEVSSR